MVSFEVLSMYLASLFTHNVIIVAPRNETRAFNCPPSLPSSLAKTISHHQLSITHSWCVARIADYLPIRKMYTASSCPLTTSCRNSHHSCNKAARIASPRRLNIPLDVLMHAAAFGEMPSLRLPFKGLDSPFANSNGFLAPKFLSQACSGMDMYS